jgi:hypothetical protein
VPHKRNLNAQLNLCGLPEDENQEWRWPDAKAKEEGKKSEEQVIVYKCENILNIRTHLHVLGLLQGTDERLGRSTASSTPQFTCFTQLLALLLSLLALLACISRRSTELRFFAELTRAAYQGRMRAG